MTSRRRRGRVSLLLVLWALLAGACRADVQPPAAQQVVDPTPDDAFAPESDPKLPPPTVDGTSVIEFRPVLSEPAGACPAPPTPPAPDRPAVLPIEGGSCLELAPSALTVTRAEVAARSGSASELEVTLTLDQNDAVAFDRLAAANLGQRVAIVLFGRVLSAPVIHHASFDGHVAINGLDPQRAADVIAALSQ